jgi:hypothetical protein
MANVRGIALVANQDGRLELVATTVPEGGDPSGGVWYARQTAPNGDWTGWKSLVVPVDLELVVQAHAQREEPAVWSALTAEESPRPAATCTIQGGNSSTRRGSSWTR